MNGVIYTYMIYIAIYLVGDIYIYIYNIYVGIHAHHKVERGVCAWVAVLYLQLV